MELFIDNVIDYLNNFPVWVMYLFFFTSGALQIIFVPYPGDSVLLLGGYLGSRGLYGGFVPLFFSYWSATLIFSFLLFEIGYWQGKTVLNLKIVQKHFSDQDQKRVQKFIIRYGVFVYLVGKFFPGTGFLTLLIGGILRHKRRWAYPGILCASFLHNLLLYLVGRKVGDSWENISAFLKNYNKVLIVTAIIAILGYGVWYFFKKSKVKSYE